ncbi:hypothetical protein PmB_1659g0001, partial [Pasteurella multocida]
NKKHYAFLSIASLAVRRCIIGISDLGSRSFLMFFYFLGSSAIFLIKKSKYAMVCSLFIHVMCQKVSSNILCLNLFHHLVSSNNTFSSHFFMCRHYSIDHKNIMLFMPNHNFFLNKTKICYNVHRSRL